MTMLDQERLAATMLEHLRTLSTLATTVVRLENRSDPSPDGSKIPEPGSGSDDPAMWIRETTLIDGDERKAGIGGPSLILSAGETRYDVFVEKGRGTKEAHRVAKIIAEGFEGGSLTDSQSALEIRLERSTRLPGRNDADAGGPAGSVWYFVPVVITWRVYTVATL